MALQQFYRLSYIYIYCCWFNFCLLNKIKHCSSLHRFHFKRIPELATGTADKWHDINASIMFMDFLTVSCIEIRFSFMFICSAERKTFFLSSVLKVSPQKCTIHKCWRNEHTINEIIATHTLWICGPRSITKRQ